MPNLSEVFKDLRGVMDPCARKLDCTIDNEEELQVYTKYIQENKKPLWFGAVQIRKNYVSYHLLPVYVTPSLLEGISPELKKRMQGKSCFNFTSSAPVLFKELAELTEAGFRDYRRQGYV
jgi:hypothetical protein